MTTLEQWLLLLLIAGVISISVGALIHRAGRVKEPIYYRPKEEKVVDRGGLDKTPSRGTPFTAYRSDAAEEEDLQWRKRHEAFNERLEREWRRHRERMDAENERRFNEAYEMWTSKPRLEDPQIIDGEWKEV